MIRVGIVGLGFMGRMHYRCWSNLDSARITAVCETNPQALAAASQPAGGNVAGAADEIDLDSLQIFTDFDTLLGSGTVDAISLTLPTFLHADFTEKALKAGIHVLCEKPMALTVAECDRMIDAAEASRKILQIGHCIRFWPEYVVARQIIQGRTLGRVIGASFRRFTALPGWSPDSWFADEKRSGGQPLDLHIHDSDYIHHLFGMPSTVASTGPSDLTYIATQYRYPEGPAVVAESTWRMAPSFGFEMSFAIALENGSIHYDVTRDPSFRVLTADPSTPIPTLPPGDGYSRQVDHFARQIRGESVESIITPLEARESIRLVLAEKQAAHERRLVHL